MAGTAPGGAHAHGPHGGVRGIIAAMPKAELHVHLEGTLEPEMMFEIAKRNGVELPFASPADVRAAYLFQDLQSFLDIYYQAAEVLLNEEDFFDLAWAYLVRAHADGVRHVEAFFDPQTHTARGVPFGLVVTGLRRAFERARGELGMSFHLIMCFVRHLPEADALATLDASLAYRHWITGVGLDSTEIGHPPDEFANVYERARAVGYLPVAHVGEEGPAHHVTLALDLLKIKRIDHGIRCMDDPLLVQRLAQEQVPLTVCPLSNIRLRVFPTMKDHSLKRMLEQNLLVTVNSDDPAYFGGYVAENYFQVHAHLGIGLDGLFRLAENSFRASFLSDEEREAYLEQVEAFKKTVEEAAAPALVAV